MLHHLIRSYPTTFKENSVSKLQIDMGYLSIVVVGIFQKCLSVNATFNFMICLGSRLLCVTYLEQIEMLIIVMMSAQTVDWQKTTINHMGLPLKCLSNYTDDEDIQNIRHAEYIVTEDKSKEHHCNTVSQTDSLQCIPSSLSS